MSVYSGFSTRRAESDYDRATLKLLRLLCDSLSRRQAWAADPSFRDRVLDVLLHMAELQASKYLPPKLAQRILVQFHQPLGLSSIPSLELKDRPPLDTQRLPPRRNAGPLQSSSRVLTEPTVLMPQQRNGQSRRYSVKSHVVSERSCESGGSRFRRLKDKEKPHHSVLRCPVVQRSRDTVFNARMKGYRLATQA